MVDLFWTPKAIPGLLALAMSWGAAGVIYAAAPRRPMNRMLALALAVEGAHFGSYFGVRYLVATLPLEAAAIRSVEWTAQVSAGFLYLAFLGTVAAPLSRPLARPVVRKALVAAAALWILAWPLTSPYIMAHAMVPEQTTGGQLWSIGDQPISDLANTFNLLVFLYGFAVAWSAYRAARPGTARRSQALAYSRAFGVRDVVWALAYVRFSTGRLVAWPEWTVGPTNMGPPIAGIAFILLLGYGILRHQLFDIEVKVKRTVKQGTVVAALVGTYIATTLGARAFMSTDAAQTTGVILTGLLLFAMVPLQRLGSRVADAAMPGVRDEKAYLDQRRIEVYRASLEDALEDDGVLTEEEADRLSRLRARLGLSDRDHALLVHAVREPGVSPLIPRFEPGREVLGRYRIEEALGEGGQGTTYRALDTTLGREVVLKALHGHAPKDVLKEARALARVDHPNVVTIHDVERVGTQVYLVMEHVDGGSLKDRLRTGTLGEEGFQRLAGDLLTGLQAVHDAGMIHRDVKPSNVLLTLDGAAKLADLGIATTAEPGDQTTLGQGSASARGSIPYMSPEQAKGEKLTPASDLFSVAATLYEAYTGRPLFEPFPGESAVELQARVAGWRGFDGELDDQAMEAWFARALAPDPGDRFEAASGMRAGLR